MILSLATVLIVAQAQYERCQPHDLEHCAVVAGPNGVLGDARAVFTNTGMIGAGQIANAAALEAIIRDRVSQVTQRMLLDALRGAAKNRDVPVVLEDTLGFIAALAISTAEKETISQTLTTGVLRAGLTLAIGAAAQDETCKDERQRLDAAYEGLATSPALRSLGFTAAKGVVPKGCESLAARITQWADLIGAAGDPSDLDADLRLFERCMPADGGVPGADNRLLTRIAVRIEGAERSTPVCEALASSLTERVRDLQLRGDQDAPAASGQLQLPMPPAVFRSVEAVLLALAHRKAVSKGDLVVLINEAKRKFESGWPKTGNDFEHADAKKLVDTFLSALPTAIREDRGAPPAQIKLDGVALASEMVSSYVDDHRRGLYLRATIGVGGLLGTATGGKLSACLHEELGVGFRLHPSSAVLLGPHIGVSGLLYKLQLNTQATDNLFVFGGFSVNLYRLIDVSLSVGLLSNTVSGLNQFGGTLSLQIPLADYVKDAVSAPSIESSR